jgi:hypothetical protein
MFCGFLLDSPIYYEILISAPLKLSISSSYFFNETLEKKAIERESLKDDTKNNVPQNNDSAFPRYISDELVELQPNINNFNSVFHHMFQPLFDNPSTLSTLKKELVLTKKQEKKIHKMMELIDAHKHIVENISSLYNTMAFHEEALEEYSPYKKLISWLFNKKLYKQTKESLGLSKKILKNNYGIEKKEDFSKRISQLDSKKMSQRFLTGLLQKVVRKKGMLIRDIRTLSKKIKSSIISQHPELAHFVENLACEQAQNLKTLKEKYNFNPKDDSDFDREIKNCKNTLKFSSNLHVAKKLRLLESVFVEVTRNTNLAKLQKQHSKDRDTDKPLGF